MNDKQTIRHTYINKRKALAKTIQTKASHQVCLSIEALFVYQQATHIALYHAIEGEIDLTLLFETATEQGKICYMPVLHNKTLVFIKHRPNDATQMNQFNIKEPIFENTHAIAIDELDLMIVPLVAFDSTGTRLGRGAGYYDKALANQKPKCLLGAAYAFQHIEHLVREPWDVPLDGVITECGRI